ncbi:MAG: hypothetical protein KDA58_06215 [Planctomycetaceae bacterium]|nr:hypothetical protein [Planctomycetaceae bacterium]
MFTRWLLIPMWVCCFVSPAAAQGLIWSLPADGSWIRYEGTYSQTLPNQDATEQPLLWRRDITIRSVGQEQAEYQGQQQACRWIEIKIETGKTDAGVLDAGPGGSRLYKLLVPESAVRGTVFEPVPKGKEIFASFIPVVKGYRKIGDEQPAEVAAGVFQLYPVVSLLQHYRNLAETGTSQALALPTGNVNAQGYTGSLATESTSYRSTSTAELYRSTEIPFGVAKWTATTAIEEKGTTDPRSAFTPTITIKEEMQAAATGGDAESELLVN